MDWTITSWIGANKREKKSEVWSRLMNMWRCSVDYPIARARSCYAMPWLSRKAARPNSTECSRHGEKVTQIRFGSEMRSSVKTLPRSQHGLWKAGMSNGFHESLPNWKVANRLPLLLVRCTLRVRTASSSCWKNAATKSSSYNDLSGHAVKKKRSSRGGASSTEPQKSGLTSITQLWRVNLLFNR